TAKAKLATSRPHSTSGRHSGCCAVHRQTPGAISSTAPPYARLVSPQVAPVILCCFNSVVTELLTATEGLDCWALSVETCGRRAAGRLRRGRAVLSSVLRYADEVSVLLLPDR